MLPGASPVQFSSVLRLQQEPIKMTKPICLWSGPRNVSTALMYSFAQRPDIRVIDEPLYGHYLKVSGAQHPGRDEILKAMNCDGDSVMANLLREQAEDPGRTWFIKHMAHHLVALNLEFLKATVNVFLVRDPHQMLPSLTVQLPHASLSDTGLKQQWELFSELSDAGQKPAILDSKELLLDPAGTLQALCTHLDLEFTTDMLHWEAGARIEDGIWARHWYHAVHKSTGFAPYIEKPDFPEKLQPLLEECSPWYAKLYAHALRTN